MRNESKLDLLTKIQELGFACLDLNLYLDNHPDDKKAISTYNSFSAQFSKVKYEYESKYGTLTNFGYGQGDCSWQWVNQPWPWDREFYN